MRTLPAAVSIVCGFAGAVLLNQFIQRGTAHEHLGVWSVLLGIGVLFMFTKRSLVHSLPVMVACVSMALLWPGNLSRIFSVVIACIALLLAVREE